MPSVLIFPEAYYKTDAPYVQMFQDAGFEIRYPEDPTFTRGLHSEEETIEVIAGVDATVAGGEHYTPRVIESLPQLKVIARAGVGFDRVCLSHCSLASAQAASRRHSPDCSSRW